jgi:hypothetical protein
VGHGLFPERAHKIFIDGIKSHPFHVEIGQLSSGSPEKKAKWTGKTALSQKKSESRSKWMIFKVFISPRNHPLPFS